MSRLVVCLRDNEIIHETTMQVVRAIESQLRKATSG
jgi:hypothetical protein